MPQLTTLKELKQLFDPDFVRTHKINCIKLLRQITGDGLKETKDFLELELAPFILDRTPMPSHADYDANKLDPGDPLNIVPGTSPSKEEGLKPPMFLIGHSYRQLNKEVVLIVGASNQGTSYETVYSINGDGKPIHRYNRRDYGRCTGTDHLNPSQFNLEMV